MTFVCLMLIWLWAQAFYNWRVARAEVVRIRGILEKLTSDKR